MEQKCLYTIIYPFMSGVLRLSGLTKECFATIFNFWLFQGQHPVRVSLTTMQATTGGTRPAIIQAVHKLENAGLILASRAPGKKTTYDVILPKQILTEFANIYMCTKLVNTLYPQRYTPKTSASTTRIPHNIKKTKNEINCPLRVKSGADIHTGGLNEA